MSQCLLTGAEKDQQTLLKMIIITIATCNHWYSAANEHDHYSKTVTIKCGPFNQYS